MAILDLPLDLLVLITPHLPTDSFLAFTSTCRALHTPQIREDPLFWSARVQRDFRVPNQPVVASDGLRWMKLYKRLRTQSRIFTWGNNERGCLGHSWQNPTLHHKRGRPLPDARMGSSGRKHRVGWPEEMQGLEQLGIVSDLQCGGWSTTLLSSKGVLYGVGVLDGQQYRQRVQPAPHALHFPPALSQPAEHYNEKTATKQFSAGRAHILALSDSGCIWSWKDFGQSATQIKFVHHDIAENGKERGRSVVRKVVAGWNKSAVLIEGAGIVVWEPVGSDEDAATLILESVAVPRTYHIDTSRSKSHNIPGSDDLGESVGEVQSFIVLEDCVLFNTSRGRVFASLITWTDDRKMITDPIRLSIPGGEDFVTDVQGSFQNFAIFLQSGAVLTSTQERLMPLFTETNLSTPYKLWKHIPALQNKQVIALAFGDYHFHALHAPGHITSYGYEPQSCGALGLGEGRQAALRGVRSSTLGGDGTLTKHAYTEGRRVWFERPKRNWMQHLAGGAADRDLETTKEAWRMAVMDAACQGEVSEWIEQQGRDWGEQGEDGLGAYFALGVAAAGWHSGALVLVNSELVEKLETSVRSPRAAEVPRRDTPAQSAQNERHNLGIVHSDPGSSTAADSSSEGYTWDQDAFPRLQLSDGREMPGAEGRGFDEWKYGRPEFKLNWEDDSGNQVG